MFRKVIALTILTGFFTAMSAAASVGAAPGSIDLGEIEQGETVERGVYVTTNFDENFVINPEYRSGSRSSMFSSSNNRSGETSEQDIESWIDIQEDITIDPNETISAQLEDGRSVRAEGVFDFTLSVPNDADPGYHYGSFRLNPDIEGDGSGSGTVNFGETRVNFVFRVPGQAERSIEVTDINGIRIGENNVQIVAQLQNTGTVTTSLRSSELTVFDENEVELDEIRLSSATLAPGEVAEIDTTWTSEDVEGGNYEVEGIGDYRTGETHISGDFAITSVVRDPVEVDEPEADSEEDTDIPYTLLLMVLLFLGVILYLLEIDLVWTIIFVGVTGISLFILFSSAPTYLILILLGLIGVTLYYGI